MKPRFLYVLMVMGLCCGSRAALAQPTGGCCLPDGTCESLTEEQCLAMGGEYAGDGVDCGNACPGACCFQDLDCQFLGQVDCESGGGFFQGNGTECAEITCNPFGACCLPDGECEISFAQDCSDLGGTYQGDGTACEDVLCPQPTGACCFPDGSCDELTEEDCIGAGGIYQGDLTDCAGVDCPQPVGACCFPDGSCDELTEEDCTGAGGIYQGNLTDCDGVDCPQPDGACCFPDGSCAEMTEQECNDNGGSFQGAFTTCADVECAQPSPGRLSATEKGSLLIFPKVELRWAEIEPEGGGEDGTFSLIQDTFIQIVNDYPAGVSVLMYFINGDPPLWEGDRFHPGWNNVDNEIELTSNQPMYWSALTGQPAGVSPFQVLDPGDPPGRPAMDGTDDRVLRGYIVAWAVDSVSGEEIRWNHLAGLGTIVNYLYGSAFEYNTYAHQVVAPVDHGDPTGIEPGVLALDGVEYNYSFDQLLLQFQAVGSPAFSGPRLVVSNTDVTLLPASLDVRQETDGPVTTKAHYDVWNMNEVKLSGAYRCITCWDQTLLSNYGIPNHFFIQTLQTAHGKARIDGLASQLCPGSIDAALVGIAVKKLAFDFDIDFDDAATNLVGMGEQAAVIRYDVLVPPPEAPEDESAAPLEIRKKPGSLSQSR
jgi:hypothetical protein